MSKQQLQRFFLALFVVLLALAVMYIKEQAKEDVRVNEEIRVKEGVREKSVRKQSKPVGKVDKKGVSQPNGVFSVAVDRTQPIRIGIMGESSHAVNGVSFDEKLLKQLLHGLKEKGAQAIFFTGNLVSSEDSSGPLDTGHVEQELQLFSQTLVEAVGEKFPFFPNVGKNEERALQDMRQFQAIFHLENGILLDDKALVYGVSIGNAFFAVIPTHYEPIQNASTVKSDVLSWLDNTLNEAKQKHRYLFVVGHMPAFLVTPLFINKPQHDDEELWKVLSTHNVSAYFASQNHLFDRSNHGGIWQIISGGSGDGREDDQEHAPFFHSLLLTIMPDDTPPKVDLLNEKGKVVEEFELKPNKDSLLYQLHISFYLKRFQEKDKPAKLKGERLTGTTCTSST